jgi:hypothetical protein
VLPAIAEAAAVARSVLPGARHVYEDACERHAGAGSSGLAYAAFANDRRFFVLDALLGRLGDPARRPFAQDVRRAGGARLWELPPVTVDVLGLDYYAHNQWLFGETGGVAPGPDLPPLRDLIAEYAQRYGLPCMLSETNIRGHASDRATWLKHTLEQCEQAVAAGVAMDGYCWFPTIDSCDWDSLLARADGHIDPVGAYTLDDGFERQATSMTAAYARVGHGASAADLPAYRLRAPVDGWLAGLMAHMAHYDWQAPPPEEVWPEDDAGPQPFDPLGATGAA